jgi:DNA-binding transcriptional LysR family regulator
VDLDAVRTFVAVADTGQFQAAGDGDRGLTPPGDARRSGQPLPLADQL